MQREQAPAASTPAARTARPDEARTVAAEAILGAFDGQIRRVRTSPLYQLGLVFVAFAMVLLPLCYLALIGLTGYLLYYHAVYNAAIFQEVRSARGAVLIYLGPLAAGAILLFFMFKPLFARRAHRERWRSLQPKEEAKLFAFVARICEAVRAPVPRRIDVDAQVNASARFRRGVWSMLRSDLVLTIGLPLAAGLTMRQFAGVLAHEFGHFSQGLGMRLTYLIRTINAWFARVVYERDAWDEKLKQWSELDGRLAVVVYLARFFIWCTRRILWVLMWAAHAISCFMLRQMEYDADRHEARLAGSETFATTVRQLVVLNVAAQGARSDLGECWQEGRLGDDYSALVLANVGQIPAEAQKRIDEHIAQSKTGWFDTHPADEDRIANAAREQSDGIFRLEAPAAALFADFSKLSKLVTLDYYHDVLGQRVQAQQLIPVSALVGRQQQQQREAEARARFFYEQCSPLRPLALPAAQVAPPDDARATLAKLKAARDQMRKLSAGYRISHESFAEADSRALKCSLAESILSAGYRIDADALELPKATRPAARAARDDAVARQRGLDESLKPFETAAVDRLLAALALLHVPQVAAKVEQADRWKKDVPGLLDAAAAIERISDPFTELRRAYGALVQVLSNLGNDEASETVSREVLSQAERIVDRMQAIARQLGAAPYPFDHAETGMTLAKYLVPGIPGREDVGAVYRGADALLDKTVDLHGRLCGRLAWIAESVEAALGLPKSEVPVDSEAQQEPVEPPPM